MKKLIIGVDPDVDGKGFAIYEDGVLIELNTISLIDLNLRIDRIINNFPLLDMELHIEDLCANKSSSFSHRRDDPPGVKYKKSESVGRCKQMQIEVEKVAEHFDIKIVRHKVSSRWKKGPAALKEFERVTGWKGRSNEDTRSAAYFGYLGVIG
jgi:hypothetical protein